MKRFLMLILCGMLISVCAQAQVTTKEVIRVTTDITGLTTCTQGRLYYNATSLVNWERNAAGVCAAITSGGTPGNVVAPASSTHNAAARFDSTTGKLLQNSGVIIDDSNNITGVASINKVTITAPATSATLTVTNGQTLSYTEGTWTPVRSGFTEVIGAGSFTNTGTYVKIGKQVTVRCLISPAGGATIAATAGAASIQGLPFSGGSMAGSGSFDKADAVTHGGVLVHVTDMFVTTSFSASSSEIVFSATYLVP